MAANPNTINTPQNYCKVNSCRFSQFHTTIAHRCGRCNQYGHGLIECNDHSLKQHLIQFLDERMPSQLHCNFHGCSYPTSHSSDSHHCFRCGERGTHSAPQCRLNRNNREIYEHPEVYERSSSRVDTSGNIYHEYHTEGGASSGGASSGGASSGGASSGGASSGGATKLSESTIHKKCPICRECSNVDLTNQIFTGTECVICMENKKKVVFENCKHASVCHECVLLL